MSSNSKAADSSESEKPTQPPLGLLEEDDEFEEFPAVGEHFAMTITSGRWRRPSNDPFSLALLDWNDSETDLAHLGGVAPGSAKSGGDKLWEDNWDDDDIEDEFSVQLRCVLGSDLQCILS